MTVGQRAKSSASIAERRRKVAALYLRHVDQVDIGRQLAVDQSTISRDVDALKEEWRDEAAELVNERIHQELVELDQMEREAVLEFARTRLPRWVDVRLSIKEYRAKLLGWLKPGATVLATQVNIDGQDQYANLSDSELDERITLALQIRDRAVLRQAQGDQSVDGIASIFDEVVNDYRQTQDDPRAALTRKLDGLNARRRGEPEPIVLEVESAETPPPPPEPEPPPPAPRPPAQPHKQVNGTASRYVSDGGQGWPSRDVPFFRNGDGSPYRVR